MESPCTETALASSGSFAGPLTTAPSRLNLLPWHGQSMVPSSIFDTLHPACVHTEENPLNTPAVGCVSTMSSRITPEPTGTSAVFARAAGGAGAPEDPDAAGAGAGAELADDAAGFLS